MPKSRLAAALSVLAALALPGVASAADSLEPRQWDVGSSRVSPARAFDLRNTVNRSQLGHEGRRFGVDLGWRDSGDWRAIRRGPTANVRDHRDVALTPEDKVAIYHTKSRRYLAYGSQTFGIDLQWSSTPAYEWKLDVAPSGEASLFNTRANDHVVYGKRPAGINLMWLKSLRAQQPAAVGSTGVAGVWMTAQPVVSGYVPFLGSYGGGGWQAVVTRVANPANGATLRFVKPGRSTSDCAADDAVVRLGPGQALTAEQMRAIWGTATPSLGNPVRFLACAATQQRSVAVNVQYRTTG